MNKPKLKVVILEGSHGINAEYVKEKKKYTGMMYEIWQKVKKGLETKYTFEEKFIKPLNYDDLVDNVHNGKYDIIIGNFVMTYNRLKKVNFTNTLYISNNAILFKKKTHIILEKIVYILKHIILLPLFFLLILGIILGNILHYVEPNRYTKAGVKKIYARRRNVLTTTAALLGEMGFLFENSTVSYLGMFIIIIIAFTSITVLMVLQGEIIAQMGKRLDSKYSLYNMKNLKLVAQDGYMVAQNMKHYGASVKFIKNKTVDEIIEKYIVNSNEFDGMPLTLQSAEEYAKKYDLSVASHDMGWTNMGWVGSKKYPTLIIDIDKEIAKLKSNFFIKDMCEKYFINKKDSYLCIF